MLMGDCPLTFSLATSDPSTALIHWGAGHLLPVLPSWRRLVPREAGPGPWRGILCSCSDVLLTLLPGPEPGSVGHYRG